MDISVIIPTFRRERELREAVHSVLAVSGLQVEVLVIDDSPDGSAAATIAALDDSRVQYQRRATPSGGRPALARNEAALMARGRVLYFLDDDDRAIARSLEAAYRSLMASPHGALISLPLAFGDDPVAAAHETRHFAVAGALLSRSRSRWTIVARLLFGQSFLVSSACLVKRQVFAAVGGYDPTIPMCEGTDFYLRAVRAAGHVYFPEALVERRIGHPSLLAEGIRRNEIDPSYRLFGANYRRAHGVFEMAGLRLLHKVTR